MSGYWIKLYQEILDDPKMAVLPDRLWRRIVELFLLAGRTGDSGVLPSVTGIAWILRIPVDDVQLDMEQIATTGIIHETENGWVVSQFEKRQSPSSSSERSRKQRESERKKQYYGDATQMQRKCNANATKRLTDQIDRLTDNRIDNRTEQTVSTVQKGVSNVPDKPVNPFVG